MKRAVAVFLLALAAGCDDHDHDHDHDHGGHSNSSREAPPFDPLAAHVRSDRHGGLLTETGRFRIETAFGQGGVAVWVETASGQQVDVAAARGRIAIESRDPDRLSLEAELQPRDGRLVAALDLSELADGAARAVVRIDGLPGEDESIVYRREVRFTHP